MLRAVFAIAVLVLFTACPGGETRDYAKGGPPENTNTIVPPSPENAEVIDPNKEMPTRVPQVANPAQTVELTEYAIRMPPTVPAGTHSFRIMNAGTLQHSFEIEGNGVEVKLPDNLARGDMKTIDVTLQPGTYEVYCPVGNHRSRGMQTTLVVK